LKSDESCIANPKSEISNRTLPFPRQVAQSDSRFRISDLQCRIRPISKFPFATLCLLLLLVGCRQQMADQPRYEPLEESDLFADHRSARPLPIGVVARGHLDDDDFLYAGRVNGQLATTFPFEITADVLARGRDRYNIFCTPCHDYVGTGNGMAVRRGFRERPPSFHLDRLRQSPPGHFFDVITNGFGAMNDYAAQIKARDRWAIIAYIRALQFSQNVNVNELPSQDRQELGRAR
jgi:Cytochrome C oxidase, cbb3-type, subunit III